MGTTEITVLEALGGRCERVRHAAAGRFDFADVGPLNIVGLEVDVGPQTKILPLSAGLDDSLFEHDGQLTKREVRAVTLAALAPVAAPTMMPVSS